MNSGMGLWMSGSSRAFGLGLEGRMSGTSRALGLGLELQSLCLGPWGLCLEPGACAWSLGLVLGAWGLCLEPGACALMKNVVEQI